MMRLRIFYRDRQFKWIVSMTNTFIAVRHAPIIYSVSFLFLYHLLILLIKDYVISRKKKTRNIVQINEIDWCYLMLPNFDVFFEKGMEML